MLERPTAPWQVFRRWQWWVAGSALLLLSALTARFWMTGDSTWARAVLLVALDFLPWIAVLPLVLWLAWRFPLESGTRWKHGALHLAAGLLCAATLPLATSGIARLLGAETRGQFRVYRATLPPPRTAPDAPVGNGSGMPRMSPPQGEPGEGWRGGGLGPVSLGPGPGPDGQERRFPPPPRPSFWHFLLFRAPWSFAVYGLILAVGHTWRAAQRDRERVARAAELERQLAEARLTNLSRQLQPHFLFNTLNTIVSLVRREPAQAENMLLDLSDLLRRTLEAGERPTVPLAEELALLDLYIELQRGRFGSRVRIERRIDPAALDARVPALFLQPLVENSFRHGIEGTAGPVTLTVEIQRLDDRVRLVLIDDAPKRTPLTAPAIQPAENPALALTSTGPAAPAKPDAATAETTDAPVRPTPRRRASVGLANTRSRLAALHGAALHFMAQPGADRGFVVELSFPFEAATSFPHTHS